VGDFDPSKGPQFGGQKPSKKLPLTADQTRTAGFVVGALGGDIADAAVTKYAFEHAREAGEDRRQTKRTPKPARRSLWKRLRGSR
jgi:hypothetical protein